MAKYMFQGSYSLEGARGLLREGGSRRREAVAQLVRSLGGRLEGFYYAFGDTDLYMIVDLPDHSNAPPAPPPRPPPPPPSWGRGAAPDAGARSFSSMRRTSTGRRGATRATPRPPAEVSRARLRPPPERARGVRGPRR